MGLRFRKSFRLLPGVRLTVGRRGVGASIGPRGASVSVGKTGVHAQAGLPGTGLSYRTKLGGSQRRDGDAPHRKDWTEGPLGTFFFLVGLVAVLAGGIWLLTAML